jgi:hypothetical protein
MIIAAKWMIGLVILRRAVVIEIVEPSTAMTSVNVLASLEPAYAVFLAL